MEAYDYDCLNFFLNRGMKYCDLVLKHKGCFMQYQGLLCTQNKKSPKNVPLRYWRSSDNHKESVDGRVMIDQVGYAKMKPNQDMGTASPSRNWLGRDRPRMDQVKP